MAKPVTFVAVTPDGVRATRTSKVRTYTHARWIDYADGKGKRLMSWHMTEEAASKSLPPAVRERGLAWGVVPVTVEGEAPQEVTVAPAAVTPEPAPLPASNDPRWFEPTKTPTVFHIARREDNGLTSAVCNAQLRPKRTNSPVPWNKVPGYGLKCPKCRDIAEVDVPAAAAKTVGNGEGHQCVGISGVGAWFGYSKAAVSKWRKDHPNTPAPDVSIDGHDGWLPEREDEWRRWYETDGPGRPSYAKRKHLRLVEHASSAAVVTALPDRLRTPEEIAADPLGNGDFAAVFENLAQTMAQTDRSNAARRAAAARRNKESAK